MRGLGGSRPPARPAGPLASARSVGPLLLWSALSGAPMQCGNDPDPSTRREETPAEALLVLATEFEKAGDRDGQVRTLRFIVQRHPRARQAEDARVTLRGLGIEPDEPTAGSGAEAPRGAPPGAERPEGGEAAP